MLSPKRRPSLDNTRTLTQRIHAYQPTLQGGSIVRIIKVEGTYLMNVYRNFVLEALEEYPVNFEFALEDAKQWDKRRWRDRAGLAYLAGEGEYYLGTVSLRQDTGYSTHVGEIKFMYVPRSRQGNGLGQKLLTAAENIARERGIEQLFLTVVNPNPAFKLYERAGYIVHGYEMDIRRVEGEKYGRYLMHKVLG